MGRTRKYKRYSPEFKRDALKCARIYEEKTGKKTLVRWWADSRSIW